MKSSLPTPNRVPYPKRFQPPKRPICHLLSVICHSARGVSTDPAAVLLDFASPPTTFVGFEAPVAQLDRVYDFGS